MPSSAKKTTNKKAAQSSKKSAAPKKSASKVSGNTGAHFTHDALATKVVSHPKKTESDTSMFTTLLALCIVAFVVLGGFVYSRQAHKTDVLSENLVLPGSSYQSNTPLVDISSTVNVTPELETELRALADIIYIESDDMLVNVSIVSDVVSVQAQNWDLYKNAAVGDYVFQFKNRSILYRPGELKIINVVPGAVLPQA